MKFYICFAIVLSACLSISGQSKQIMDHTIYDEWKRFEDRKISHDGKWVVYESEQIKSDPQIYIYNSDTRETSVIERASSARIDYENKFVAFLVHPARDSVRAWKRAKKKVKKLDRDTLAIYSFVTGATQKIPDVKSFKMPEEWGGCIAYVKTVKKDSITKTNKSFVVLDPDTQRQLSFKGIGKYQFAEEAPKLVFNSGKENKSSARINYFDCERFNTTLVHNYKGQCEDLTISANGESVAYMIDPDTLSVEPIKVDLFAWQVGDDNPKKLLGFGDQRLKKGFTVSKYSNLDFTEDGSQLFFGVSELPLVKDSTLIDEEIVNVEVWSYKDQALYTQQENNKRRDQESNFLAYYDLNRESYVQLGSDEVPFIRTDEKKDDGNFLGLDNTNYRMYITSHGYAYNDFFLVSKLNGRSTKILEKEQGRPSISPFGKYAVWYNAETREWKSLNTTNGSIKRLTNSNQMFADELNDRPMDPRSYGIAFWGEKDKYVYINDRYDIWRFDLKGDQKPTRITNGRNNQTVYRYVDLNREDDFEPDNGTVMLHLFDENDKSSGYASLSLADQKMNLIEKGPYRYSRSILKAKHSDDAIFTKESFETFPDLIKTNLTQFSNQEVITDLNPQQENYNWGSIELFKWKGDDGKEHTGMIAKPEDFDPAKKYPVIINFYERSSDGLHRHRAPFPGRSTINYTYYVNRGYVIFNPDVFYEIGYPGRSALETVVSGTNAIKKYNWVDGDRIGLQGHSWGGYQVAHILTQTDMFACAESGAPVVNMVSAYGGIRWGSGMSRMFQYERTQSRLGGTLWEKPELYLENSPVFNLDKHVTPVLILHNDNDGAVPWYQGIEYFVGLRRLGRPAWFLNYNEEPHWPLKLQNRLDFNRRMEQFFDHFLKDAAMPSWMDRGIPELEKGINDGFELIEDK